MAIKLNKFVNININYNLSTSSSATRDTAVLIINTNTSENINTYDSMDKLLKAYSSDSRFAKGGELYYYAYCFFYNGGKKLMIYEIPTGVNYKYEKVVDQSLIFNSQSNFYFINTSGDKATPLNSNNGSQLYEEFTREDTSSTFEDGINYYKVVDSSYVIATPANCELYTEEEGTYTPCTETSFASTETYYSKDGSTYTLATPVSLELYKKVVEVTEDTEFKNKIYYKNENKGLATPANCDLYTRTEIVNPLNDSIKLATEIKSLSNNYIVISSNAPWNIMKDVCDSLYNEQEGMNIESKLILSCIDNESTEPLPDPENPEDLKKITSNGFVLKYGTPGVQMAIAAYLTQINANRPNSVQDYYFTTETVQYTIGDGEEKETIGYICEDDSLAETLLALEINFNSTLVNEVRNLGGNTTKGKDLVNEFMLILVHQTLTERLVQLLTQKIKYNQTGLSLVGATIADELQRYVNNGYLTTDKIWTDPDLIQDGITIINKNTPLQNGYKYVILPFSTLSAEDRQNHKLPSIYILIADSYAIRKIEIDGEVF